MFERFGEASYRLLSKGPVKTVAVDDAELDAALRHGLQQPSNGDARIVERIERRDSVHIFRRGRFAAHHAPALASVNVFNTFVHLSAKGIRNRRGDAICASSLQLTIV